MSSFSFRPKLLISVRINDETFEIEEKIKWDGRWWRRWQEKKRWETFFVADKTTRINQLRKFFFDIEQQTKKEKEENSYYRSEHERSKT